MLILLAGGYGGDEMSDVLGEVAMILGPALINRFLDVLALFRYTLSASRHMARTQESHTIVKASEADLQTVESRQAVLLLEACHVHVIVTLHPNVAQRL